MSKTVLVRAAGVPTRLSEFLTGRPAAVRSVLMDASQQLATTGRIDGHRAGRLENGDWLIWAENDRGELESFSIYISPLELTRSPAMRSGPDPRGRLGVYLEKGHAQGNSVEFIEAHEYIERRFRGEAKLRLRDALEKALEMRTAFDGTIEWKATGVILRAPSTETQLRSFDAEIELVWER